MSCARTRSRIERLVDGELPIDQRWMVEDHIASCERCARYFERLNVVEGVLEETLDPPVTELQVERAVATIGARLDIPAESSRRRLAPWLAAAAVVLVGSALAWANLREREISPGDVSLAVVEVVDREPTTEAPVLEEEQEAPTLVGVLSEADSMGDEALVASLAGFGAGRTRTRALEAALAFEEGAVVRGAARALALEGDVLSLRSLERALEASRDDRTATTVIAALQQFGEQGAGVLGRALERAGDLHARVVEALVAIGDQDAAAALERDWLERDGDRADASLVALLSLRHGDRAFDRVRSLQGHDAHERTLGVLRRSPHAVAHFESWIDERPDLDPLLWRFAELSETEAVRAWLVERAVDRSTRQRATACLGVWSSREGLVAWLALEDRGIGEEELAEHFAASLARDAEGGAELVRDLALWVRNGSVKHRAPLHALVARLLEVGDATAAPALRAALLCFDVLEEGSARWIALALAEVGDAEVGRKLAQDLLAGLELDRYTRAATWLAVERSAGPDALAPLLVELSRDRRRRVLAALDSPNTAGLARIARVLDRTLPSRPNRTTQP